MWKSEWIWIKKNVKYRLESYANSQINLFCLARTAWFDSCISSLLNVGTGETQLISHRPGFSVRTELVITLRLVIRNELYVCINIQLKESKYIIHILYQFLYACNQYETVKHPMMLEIDWQEPRFLRIFTLK